MLMRASERVGGIGNDCTAPYGGMTIQYLSAAQIAERWHCNRTTAVRILNRFGYAGLKLGDTKQAMRRFSKQDVDRVEAAARTPRRDDKTK